MAFNGDAVRELAAQFLVLAEKQGAHSRSWSGTASWVFLCCVPAIWSRAAVTSIEQLRFMTLPNIVCWLRLRVLAMILGPQS